MFKFTAESLNTRFTVCVFNVQVTGRSMALAFWEFINQTWTLLGA